MRVLPEPHRYAVCADADMPIKKFYAEVFDTVFIFFHPFIKPKTIDYEAFKSDTYPLKNQIVKHCRPVLWTEFLELSGIESIGKLDIGLRTSILGLKKEVEDKESAHCITETCEREKIVPPAEGFLPDILMNLIFEQLKSQGHEWLWRGDEFCTRRELEYIDDLIEADHLSPGNERVNFFTNGHDLLLTTHWDSHFSLLCGREHEVDQLVESCELEGFYCNKETEIYWSIWNEEEGR